MNEKKDQATSTLFSSLEVGQRDSLLWQASKSLIRPEADARIRCSGDSFFGPIRRNGIFRDEFHNVDTVFNA